MPWVKGQSGNPNGKPPKIRTWAANLERASRKGLLYHGKRISRKRLVAELFMQLITTGECEMPDGKRLQLDAKDWIDLAKFVHIHVDGPAKAELDLTSAGQAIVLKWGPDADNPTAPTPGPAGDSA